MEPLDKVMQLLRTVQQQWTPDRYCSRALARTRTGESVDVDHPQAVSWCLKGILRHYADAATVEAAWCALLRAMPSHWWEGITGYSDRYGWEGAQELVSHALTQLEAERESPLLSGTAGHSSEEDAWIP